MKARTGLLEVAGLSKQYEGQRALTEVSFDVHPGEILGIIGPNGAGKTTLLEAIAGMLPADAGRVLWQGAVLPASHRREALYYLPDGVRPWQEQFVTRIIEFFAAAYGVRSSRGESTGGNG